MTDDLSLRKNLQDGARSTEAKRGTFLFLASLWWSQVTFSLTVWAHFAISIINFLSELIPIFDDLLLILDSMAKYRESILDHLIFYRALSTPLLIMREIESQDRYFNIYIYISDSCVCSLEFPNAECFFRVKRSATRFSASSEYAIQRWGITDYPWGEPRDSLSSGNSDRVLRHREVLSKSQAWHGHVSFERSPGNRSRVGRRLRDTDRGRAVACAVGLIWRIRGLIGDFRDWSEIRGAHAYTRIRDAWISGDDVRASLIHASAISLLQYREKAGHRHWAPRLWNWFNIARVYLDPNELD